MNWYTAKFSIVTALRALAMGLRPSRKYGYYVLVKHEGERLQTHAWCKTKAIATDAKADYENGQKKGHYSCPCGSNKQARLCCGVPNSPALTPN